MSVETTTVGVVRFGGFVKLGVTPSGGFPAGVVLGSTPGGTSMLYRGTSVAKSAGGNATSSGQVELMTEMAGSFVCL